MTLTHEEMVAILEGIARESKNAAAQDRGNQGSEGDR